MVSRTASAPPAWPPSGRASSSGRARWPARSWSGACRRARAPRRWRSARCRGVSAPRTIWSRCSAPPPNRSSRVIVQFGAELLAFTQDADGVTGTIRTRDGETPGARPLPDRRRRRTQPRARGARHPDARQRRDLSQHQRAAQRRSHALGGRPSCRALLHRAAGTQGDVPHDQRRQPLGLPDQQPPGERLGRRVHAGALRSPGAPGGRRSGSRGRDPRRGLVGGGRPGGRALPSRPRLPGRRRGAPHAAHRRLRSQHRRAGRPQSRLEAGRASFTGGPEPGCSIPTKPNDSPMVARSPSRPWPTPGRSAGARRWTPRHRARSRGRSSSTSWE